MGPWGQTRQEIWYKRKRFNLYVPDVARLLKMCGKVARHGSSGWDSTQLKGVGHAPGDFSAQENGVEEETAQYDFYDAGLVEAGGKTVRQ